MNKLHKILLYNKQVRLYIIDCKEMTQTAVDLHKTTKVASAALGRTLAATALMSQMLKDPNEEILVSIIGDGAIEKILAVGNFNGECAISIKNANVDTNYRNDGKLDVAQSIGNGILRVQRFFEKKQIWDSQVNLQTSEIAEDFAYYFTLSEQTPSAVSLGVLIDKKTEKILQSAGFIIQLLPNTNDEIITEIEEKLSKFSLSYELEMNKSLLDIAKIFDENFEIIETKDLAFKCSCSEEKIEKALISLGKAEIQDMIEQKHFEMNCNFCNKEYIFDENRLQDLQKYFTN